MHIARTYSNLVVAYALVAIVGFLVVARAQDTKVLVVDVGRRGDDLALKFSPEEIIAEVGDMVQFQFYPLNHSAVESAFDKPCVPVEGDTGFFSGFQPLPRNTETIKTFTIVVNDTAPIFFYCSQGRHCQQGFVGVINPTPTRSLAAFKALAASAPLNLSPGEPLRPPASVPNPNPNNPFSNFPNFNGSGFNNTNFGNANKDSAFTNVGAIVGGVLGGVVFMIVVITSSVFAVMRCRDRRTRRRLEGVQRSSSRKGKIDRAEIGRPKVRESGGPFGSGRV